MSVAGWHRLGGGGSAFMATVGVLASVLTGEVDRQGVIFYLLMVLVLGIIYLPVHHLRRSWSLLTWPITVMLGVAAGSTQAPVAASLSVGMVTIGFMYAGLSQPRFRSLLLVPVALASYLFIYRDLPAGQVALKATVGTLVWVAACEMPAWLNAKLRLASAELGRLAATDPLTGLANRRFWDEHLKEMLAGSRSAVVMLVDLDHFKRFNDDHGHLAGDEMLIAFARVIEQATPRDGVASRWGGEEFALALYDASSAAQVAERIRRSVPFGQTCSIGLVSYVRGETPTELMHRADDALYRAKAGGRDRVVAA